MADDTEWPTGLEVPADEAGPTFEAPWQARAFGTVVALHHRREGFDWEDFQAALVEEVQAAEPAVEPGGLEDAYYDQWLRAAERLLVRRGVFDADELADRAAAFAAGERDAQEFIEGEHEHAHDGHGH